LKNQKSEYLSGVFNFEEKKKLQKLSILIKSPSNMIKNQTKKQISTFCLRREEKLLLNLINALPVKPDKMGIL